MRRAAAQSSRCLYTPELDSRHMRKRPAIWIVVVILALIAALFVARALRQPGRLRGASAPVSREGETRRALFSEVQPVKVSNCELKRFGEKNDGGYLLCANL